MLSDIERREVEQASPKNHRDVQPIWGCTIIKSPRYQGQPPMSILYKVYDGGKLLATGGLLEGLRRAVVQTSLASPIAIEFLWLPTLSRA